jgi:signal transduction histidine kinase
MLQPGESARILIVDDDPVNVDVLDEFLRTAGFETLLAADGEEALEKVQQGRPDLVLLDVVMPRMDGYEVCKGLKDDPQTVFLPVVMITGLHGVQERIKGVDAGADDFLTKPINPLELITRVKSLLRVKRLHDELEAHRRDLEARVAERTAQLQQALADLRDLDRLKSEFVGRVSHELRTPLLHIKGYLTLLAEGALGGEAAPQGRGLDAAVKSVLRLERLVDDVVDLGRTQAGPLALQPTSPAESIRTALAAVAPAAEARGIRVQAEIAAGLPPVLAEPQALARCLRHLLDNAVKFSPAGSAVLVQAAPGGAGKVRFSVTDQGEGIPADQLQKVFQEFYQLDGSATRRYGGTGVGLALVKMLLEAQGAEIRVESRPGQGSRFYFELETVQGRARPERHNSVN